MTVTIVETDHPMFPPAAAWTTTIALPRSEARLIREELERLFVDNQQVLYVLDERAGRFSWGADSGPFYEISLFLAQSTVDGLIAASAMKLFERLAARHRRDEEWVIEEHSPGELDRERAIEFAKWIIVSRYSRLVEGAEDQLPGHDDPLDLVSEYHDKEKESWTIALRDRFGAVYRVKIGLLDGFPTSQCIEREAPSEEL
ncbi:hypothetical protein ACIBLB_35685 [Streptosporangium canum]|uniref:hypothetical protein n=1 Tax=Streptosporangium canum TaxID=324952 RepID=UPI00378CFF7D